MGTSAEDKPIFGSASGNNSCYFRDVSEDRGNRIQDTQLGPKDMNLKFVAVEMLFRVLAFVKR